jgi:glucosyl-3-phosphoglycerate synthase
MEQRPEIDPALGLNLVQTRTISRTRSTVSVVIPAHNEESTVAEVVTEARRGLELLGIDGEILVSASGCTDDTESVAKNAGARVIESPIGKGAAIKAGLAGTSGDIVCLIDGDMRYFGDRPLSAILLEPILSGIADACVTDLYWRPLYPQMWLHGFFAPVCGYLYPEMLPKVGTTPWSGQRAAWRRLWPSQMPDDFTVDLEILMHWNQYALRLRPVIADDWTNPQRPKVDLMSRELEVVIRHAKADGRITDAIAGALRNWYEAAHSLMAEYRPDFDKPQAFEQILLRRSMQELHRQLASALKTES